MTAFQAVITVAAIIGVGIPAWIFALGIYAAAKRPRATEPSQRYEAYQKIVGFIHESLKTGTVECVVMLIAAVRELREYPEYADLSILYLEEINVDGSNKMDHVMKSELKAAETFLLEGRNA